MRLASGRTVPVVNVLALSLADPGEGGTVRVPVRACADALAAAGATLEPVTATSDAEIDQVLARLDGPARPDGLPWPDPDPRTRLVVAVAADAQLRAVLRRMVRRWAPPPSRRPPDLRSDRTVPDLPPVGLLPLGPASSGGDLVDRLGLPRQPEAVAAAVLAGHVRRLDLLRTDAGSVTVDGTLLGGSDRTGRAVPFTARVDVDDVRLSDGDEPLLAAAVANGDGYVRPDGLPLVTAARPDDGALDVAVALPVRHRWRRRVRVEVRRARGRAVTVHPTGDGVPCLDDGVAAEVSRARSWWVEPGAWGVYTAAG
ncbi:MAG TPA: hypothetical protein VIL54_15735 [Natronosporangium sp.]